MCGVGGVGNITQNFFCHCSGEWRTSCSQTLILFPFSNSKHIHTQCLLSPDIQPINFISSQLSSCIPSEALDPHPPLITLTKMSSKAMVLSIAVILSSLSLLSVFLPTVSGLYCACHDEDSDSVNGCGVSYCDHTLSLPHDPAHQS